MKRKITKLTLTAKNGIFKNLIHDIAHDKNIVHNENLEKFDTKFIANLEETKINITSKENANVNAKDWDILLDYLKEKTTGLKFREFTEYMEN